MTNLEGEVREAVSRFYDALEALLRGEGTARMAEEWHHDDFVTTVHPFGNWARGWKEVSATWEEIAQVFVGYRGHQDRSDGIGGITGLKICAMGDVAYAIGVYKSRLYDPAGDPVDLAVNCTDIVLRRDGRWKMVHHHPDQAPPEYMAFVGSLVG